MNTKQPKLLNYFLLALLVCGPFFLFFCWQMWGMEAAENIGSIAPVWGYTSAVSIACIILVSIAIWPVPRHDKVHLAILWCVKILVVLGFMLFYESFYGLDAFRYYREGMIQDFSWANFHYGQGTASMVFLASLINIIVPESYHSMKLIIGLLGFIGVYLFYRIACIYLEREDIRIFYFLGLFPSILFWSSILGKDPITLFGIAVYGLGVVGYFKKKKTSYILLIVFGILLATAIRAWLALIFVIPLGVFFVSGNHGLIRKLVFTVCAIGIFIVGFQSFSNKFAIETTQDIVTTTGRVSQGWDKGGSGQEVQAINSVADMVRFMPVGAFTALFRPLPGEIMNPFGLLAGLENLFLIILLIRIIIKGKWRYLTNDSIIVWGFLTILIWACIYGFVSYQNLGTASRFKLQILPLLVLLLGYLTSIKAENKRSFITEK